MSRSMRPARSGSVMTTAAPAKARTNPAAALFAGVGDEHRRDREQAERRQRCHGVSNNASKKACAPSGPVSAKAMGPRSGSTLRSNCRNRQH